MLSFLDRLRALREDNDLTLTQVAQVLGTSQTMYARYERGANEMPIHHLLTLCSFYNVSADFLLGVSIDKKRKQGVPNKSYFDSTLKNNLYGAVCCVSIGVIF